MQNNLHFTSKEILSENCSMAPTANKPQKMSMPKSPWLIDSCLSAVSQLGLSPPNHAFKSRKMTVPHACRSIYVFALEGVKSVCNKSYWNKKNSNIFETWWYFSNFMGSRLLIRTKNVWKKSNTEKDTYNWLRWSSSNVIPQGNCHSRKVLVFPGSACWAKR